MMMMVGIGGFSTRMMLMSVLMYVCIRPWRDMAAHEASNEVANYLMMRASNWTEQHPSTYMNCIGVQCQKSMATLAATFQVSGPMPDALFLREERRLKKLFLPDIPLMEALILTEGLHNEFNASMNIDAAGLSKKRLIALHCSSHRAEALLEMESGSDLEKASRAIRVMEQCHGRRNTILALLVGLFLLL